MAEQLTQGEYRVARLAAAGLTNKEIAAELFVTIKCVEWHLTHVYRRLQITGRDQIPGDIPAPQQDPPVTRIDTLEQRVAELERTLTEVLTGRVGRRPSHPVSGITRELRAPLH